MNMNKDAPIGAMGEVIMRVVVGGFGFLLMVWILTFSFSWGSEYLGFLVPPVVHFFLAFPYSGVILVGLIVVIVCSEIFYFRIRRPFFFYFYYLIILPAFSCAAALYISAAFLLR